MEGRYIDFNFDLHLGHTSTSLQLIATYRLKRNKYEVQRGSSILFSIDRDFKVLALGGQGLGQRGGEGARFGLKGGYKVWAREGHGLAPEGDGRGLRGLFSDDSATCESSKVEFLLSHLTYP